MSIFGKAVLSTQLVALAASLPSTAATLSIAGTSLSAAYARDGMTVTLGYQIASDAAVPAALTASMTGPASELVKDMASSGVATEVLPGTHWYYRDFKINLPPYASTGSNVFYDITYSVIWETSALTTLKLNDILKILPPVPVRVPILMYHKIGDALYSRYWNTTSMLRAQLTALRAYGYTAITCQELMDIRAGLAPAPAKPILLTFDGGYQNFWLEAMPILMEHDYPAVMFLLTGVMGQDNSWDGDNNPVIMFMTWDEVTASFNTGYMDLQSHSVTHPDLTRVTSAVRMQELVNSRVELQSRYGVPLDYFCYPYGSYNDTVKRAVREAGYFGSFAAWGGVETTCADKYALKRVPIYWDTATDYNPASSSSFFFKQIGDPLPIPVVGVSGISVTDAETGALLQSGRAHLGQTVRITATCSNTGPAAGACVSLLVDNDALPSNGVIYDSHLAPLQQDVMLTAWTGERVLEWLWTPPADAGSGPVWLSVRFQDPLCVLGLHKSAPTQALTLVSNDRSLAEMINSADGEYATVHGATVTAAFDDAFYVESADRARGLRVQMPGHSMAAGLSADFAGKLATNAEGERCLIAGSAKPVGQASVAPMATRCAWLGGSSLGLQEAVAGPVAGLNTTGLLMRISGRVVSVDPEVGEMLTDDGSGQIRCVWEDSVPVNPEWTHVLLTGISSCYRTDQGLRPLFLIASAASGL